MSDAIDVSDKTKFAMPIRNLISLIASVAVGVWAYFGIIERLNTIETNYILMQNDVTENTIFSREWPQGNLGSLPADSEQFMLIEHLSGSSTNFCTILKQVKHHSISNKHSP